MLTTNPASTNFRRHLLKSLAAGALVGLGIHGLVRQALAAGRGPQRKQGIFRLEGEATFNGQKRKVGDVLSLPLTVITGANTTLVFVLGADAYLVRSNSHLILDGNDVKAPSRVGTIKLLAGKLLSVFEKGEHRLTTPTAIAGIRGTGLYLESESQRTYICLCYGSARLGPLSAPHLQQTFSTTHHESPRWVYADRMEPANVINHDDDELILLESLTGRLPPFYSQSGYGEGILNDLSRTKY